MLTQEKHRALAFRTLTIFAEPWSTESKCVEILTASALSSGSQKTPKVHELVTIKQCFNNLNTFQQLNLKFRYWCIK